MRTHRSPDVVPTPARPATRSRPNFGAAARRDIRHAAALADELKLHSFALHGVVWTTRFHPKQPTPTKPPGVADSSTTEPSKKSIRSRERAAAHAELCARATQFLLQAALRRWKCSRARSTASDALPAARPPHEMPSGPAPPAPAPPPPATQAPLPTEPTAPEAGAIQSRPHRVEGRHFDRSRWRAEEASCARSGGLPGGWAVPLPSAAQGGVQRSGDHRLSMRDGLRHAQSRTDTVRA